MYAIIFDKKSIQSLNKIENKIKRRIFEKIISAKENPFHYFVRLKNRDEYNLRVGDYRVIADIDKNLEIIKILLIMHRKNIYKNI